MDKENAKYIYNGKLLNINNEINSFAGKCMELEFITLSEIRQDQKVK
jgi:hypothetical protein